MIVGERLYIFEEMKALEINYTWDLVPRSLNMNVVGCCSVLKAKLQANGSLERLKARLIAKGFNKKEGVDFSETFSPVIKLESICLILIVGTIKGWFIHQLDIKSAFLHGFLLNPIYMKQPPGFVDPSKPNFVCHLKRIPYGLKQAPGA